MIIWGSTGKEKTVGRGEFYCPSCRSHAPYLHRKASRYFTLYFIPLFPMETLGEYIHCEQCGGDYSEDVLQLSAAQIEELLKPWKCRQCGNTNPAGEDDCLSCSQPREDVPAGWNCEYCGEMNEMDTMVCSSCAERRTEASGAWHCRYCRTDNTERDFVCRGCAEPRSEAEQARYGT